MLSVVVPTYNEKDNVEKLVEEISKTLKDEEYEIVFIDVSKDGTDKVLKTIAQENKNVRFIHDLKLKGISKQVIYGFNIAKGSILAVMDADLQHPPYLLKEMLKEINNGADIVIPSRFIKGGNDGGLNLYRKLVSWTAREIGKIYLPNLRKISDLSSGIFMFKKENLTGVELNPIGWKIMLEVLEKSYYTKVVEIPYEFQSRNSGSSKMNKKVMLEYIKQLRILKKQKTKNNYKVVRRLKNEKSKKNNK